MLNTSASALPRNTRLFGLADAARFPAIVAVPPEVSVPEASNWMTRVPAAITAASGFDPNASPRLKSSPASMRTLPDIDRTVPVGIVMSSPSGTVSVISPVVVTLTSTSSVLPVVTVRLASGVTSPTSPSICRLPRKLTKPVVVIVTSNAPSIVWPNTMSPAPASSTRSASTSTALPSNSVPDVRTEPPLKIALPVFGATSLMLSFASRAVPPTAAAKVTFPVFCSSTISVSAACPFSVPPNVILVPEKVVVFEPASTTTAPA